MGIKYTKKRKKKSKKHNTKKKIKGRVKKPLKGGKSKVRFFNKNNKKAKKKLSKQKAGRLKNLNLIITNKISFSENRDPRYKQIGLVHITEAGAISALRDKISDYFNYFGSAGYEGGVFDVCRHAALLKVAKIIKNHGSNVKVSNLNLEIDNENPDIYVHAYGTLYQKRN